MLCSRTWRPEDLHVSRSSSGAPNPPRPSANDPAADVDSRATRRRCQSPRDAPRESSRAADVDPRATRRRRRALRDRHPAGAKVPKDPPLVLQLSPHAARRAAPRRVTRRSPQRNADVDLNLQFRPRRNPTLGPLEAPAVARAKPPKPPK